MNEQERVAYLRRMGYQVYYPRFALPGAKPSPRYELPTGDEAGLAAFNEASSPAAEGKPSSVKSPNSELLKVREQLSADSRTPPASRKRVTPSLGESDGTEPSALDEKPSARTSKPSASNADPSTQQDKSAPNPTESLKADSSSDNSAELRFSLQFYPISESLAVINESPYQVSGRQNKEVQELLSAILAALNVPLPGSGLQPEQFNWPLAEGLDVMGDSRRAAGLALQGFISQRQEQDRFRNLLVFTNQLPDLLTPDSADKPGAFGDFADRDAAYHLTLSHSLSAMLAHPQLKREVWLHLQALRNRLDAS